MMGSSRQTYFVLVVLVFWLGACALKEWNLIYIYIYIRLYSWINTKILWEFFLAPQEVQSGITVMDVATLLAFFLCVFGFSL